MNAVLTADEAREKALEHLERGRMDAFLTVASSYLYTAPDDHYVRLMAVREYLKLGLIVPAQELVDYAPFEGEAPDDIRAVRASISALRSAAVPWSTLTARFQANLAAVAERRCDVSILRDAWSQRQSRFQLFRDTKGREQIRHRGNDGKWRWMPFLGDPQASGDSIRLPKDSKTPMPGPYVFDGLELGWYLQRIHRATKNTFLGFGCALFVVEPDPSFLAVVLHLRDWEEILRDERVYWLIGDGWAKSLTEVWKQNVDLPFPTRVFQLSPFRFACDPPVRLVVEQAIARRQQEIKIRLREVEAQYAKRDIPYWVGRIAGALSGEAPPLRVLAAVSRHTTFLQYSMRDIKVAFESLGHRCEVLTESSNHTAISPLRYYRSIQELDPDLFFCLDHLRPEFGDLLPARLPLLTWDQDSLPHVFTDANLSRMMPHDFVVGYAKPHCVAAGADPRQFVYAGMPTCPEQFDGPPLTDEERERFTCDVSYVSHASQTAAAFHDEQRRLLTDPAMRRVLDVLYEAAKEVMRQSGVIHGVIAAVLLRDALERCGIRTIDRQKRDWFTGWYLWRLSDRFFRHTALEWAAEWAQRTGRSLRIYGRGWDQHPTLSAFSAGPVDNGRDLLCVYRATRINLQLMPAGFVHQRALDGLAAGGFFLTRHAPADSDGPLIRRIRERIHELRISTTHELLDHPDEALRRMLREHRGEWVERLRPEDCPLLVGTIAAAELTHPLDVFPRFREILFDSAESFAQRAERFIENQVLRRDIAEEMRGVVIQHYSYRSYLDRFLRAMAGYLKEVAG